MEEFICTTTDRIDGRRIENYLGIVTGEAVMGINFVKDWFASLKDITGGRVADYEQEIKDGEKKALLEMVERAKTIGANALVGIRFDHEALSPRGKGTVLAVVVSGTAVYVSKHGQHREFYPISNWPK